MTWSIARAQELARRVLPCEDPRHRGAATIPSILLFDVDDTLIHTGGAGRRALRRALEDLHGEGDWLGFSLSGMTDRSIVRAALRERGLGEREEDITRVIENYLARLAEEVRATPVYRVNPGIAALLERAASAPATYALGLGTGNVRRGAEIKLQRVQLDRYFSFGGFGCDHEDRAEILRAGALRGAARLARPLEHCRVVVIGDTPRDVAAALAIGAECVAVGTSGCSSQDLVASGATFAFATLAEPGATEAVLGGQSSR